MDGNPTFCARGRSQARVRAVDGLPQSVSRRFGAGRRPTGSNPESPTVHAGGAVIRFSSILNGRTNNSGGCRPPQPRIIESKQVKREPGNWLPFVFCSNRACTAVSHWTATDGMVTTRPGDAKDFCCMRSRAETFSP
jgi:hypothetical protein